MKKNRLEQLISAVGDARKLLEFGVGCNQKIEDQIISELLEKIKNLGELSDASQIDLVKEGEFWKAYQNLALAMKPVSAASINASQLAAKGRFSATTLLSIVAFFVFILLAVLQVEQIVGTTLRKELVEIDKAVTKYESEKLPLQDSVNRLLGRLEDMEIAARENKTTKSDSEKEYKQIRDEIALTRPKIVAIDRALRALRSDREPIVELLLEWHTFVTFKMWPIQTQRNIDQLTENYNRLTGELNKLKSAGKNPDSSKEKELKILNEFDLPKAKDQRVTELKHKSQLILEGMQQYVLPLILGLLGALTFILRSIIVRIREYTYSADIVRLSFVRICLGMIAGLLGGMLISPTEQSLKGIPPVVLPFLFGYAVEVVFAFLDKVVKAFVDESNVRRV